MKTVLELRKKGLHAEALEMLWKLADKSDNIVMQARYAKILSSIDQSVLNSLTHIKIAVLASSTDKFLCDTLRFWLSTVGYQATLFDSTYSTIVQTILDPDSELYKFDPKIIWIFTTYRDIHISDSTQNSRKQINTQVDEAVQQYISLWSVLKQRSSAYIIQNNADLPPYRVLGNLDGSIYWGASSVLRQFNAKLADSAVDGVTIFDLDYISSSIGKEQWFESTHWYNSKIAFNMDALGQVAYQSSMLIASIMGKAKKCLVLDLDNTLWGGVVGDDGLNGIILGEGAIGEAFVDFQKYILALKKRGVILAVCSKNDEENAKEPFLKHPDMQLTLEDISVFVANWHNKADNIKEIAALLNIGLDAMVFVDDNPVERDLVKNFIPQVSVPNLPDDPSLYRQTLDSCQYFETINISSEDCKRTDYYRGNIERNSIKNDFYDLSEYLASLDMVATVGSANSFHLPRMVQLINKSNQFHLTTTRYSETDIIAFENDANVICRYFSLKDRFGDNGLISVVLLKKGQENTLIIDTWCMSCRVLSKGMEEFICEQIVQIGLENGIQKIIGIYIPSAKNNMVSDLYKRLGFSFISTKQDKTTKWELCLTNTLPNKTTHITLSHDN